jgi:hypothetical protein
VSRAWIWALAALLLVLGGIVTAILTAPRWGTPMVRDALVDKLGKRLKSDVEIDALDLSWGRIVLTDVVITPTEIDDPPDLRFDEIVILLDEDELWGARAHVDDVTVTGGRIEGSRAGLEAFARSILPKRKEEKPEEKPRIKPVPNRARVSELWVVVSDDGEAERPRRFEGKIDLEAALATKVVTVSMSDVHLDPGRGPIVSADGIDTRVQAERGESGWSVRFPLRVDVRGVAAPVTDRISVAGVDGSVRLSDAHVSEVSVDLEGSFSDSEPSTAKRGGDSPKLWSAAGRIRRDLSEGELRLDMEAFELGKVPQVLEQLPVVDSAAATVGGHLAATFGDGVARVEGDVAIEGLNVNYRTLARTVVNDVGFELAFAAEVDPQARRVVVHYADVQRRGVQASLDAEVDLAERRLGRRVQAHVTVPSVPCQAVIDAIPDELVPSLQGFQLEGDFGMDVVLDADFSDLEALRLDGDVGVWNCKVTKAPPESAAERLAGGFTHEVRIKDGRIRRIGMYPSSSTFTSLRMISPYMVQAVLTTEDGGFYRHRGFLPSQFRVALRRNLSAGQIELGASTITMQMVKNVLLSHERTLSRKLQEMFLTWYVEQVLTKDRIMEIYLNAIEYGPGLYGITRAAAKYFGKHPIDLTPPEAVYLALMLPSPVRRHVHYCKGALSPNFEIKVQRILKIMNERGRLSDLEYEVWKDTPIQFDLSRRGTEQGCLAEIERVQAGTYTQTALSGLLADHDEGPPGGLDDDGGGTQVDPALENLPPPPADPASSDAPGRPAMDDGVGGATDGAREDEGDF